MSRSSDIKRMYEDYVNGDDLERARVVSADYLHEIIDGKRDPVLDPTGLRQAVEIQWDIPGGDYGLLVDGLRLAERAFLAEAASFAPTSERGMFYTLEINRLLSETWHRADSPERALKASYGGLSWLSRQSPGGTEEGLAEALASEVWSPPIENALGILAIHPANLRNARRCGHLSSAGQETLTKQLRELMSAYVLPLGREPVRCERTFAATVQNFYYFKHLGQPDDDALIEALYRAAVATRPETARSRATSRLQDLEWFDHIGNRLAAVDAARQALTDLKAFGLERHLKALAERGYITTWLGGPEGFASAAG